MNAIVGIGLISFYTYYVNQIQKSPAADPKFKRSMKFMLIWIIAMVFVNTVGKLFLYQVISQLKQSNPQYELEEK